MAPELPWAIHVGLGYAADVSPRGEAKVVEKIVEKPAPVVVERYIAGAVTLAGKGEPIPNAVVRYVGRAFTGMVTDESGVFQTMHLDPGEYRFAVTADGFKDGECAGTIPDEQKPVSGTTEPPAAPVRGTAAAEPVVVHVACELEALPKTATITGTLRDAETTDFIEGATVTITDPLGRQLALKTDAEGTFRFGNVPAGKSKISVEADKYLSSALELTLEPRKDVSTSVSLYKKPAVPNVVVTKTEIKLKKEVHFLTGSAEILPDSMELLEEAADAIRTHTEIGIHRDPGAHGRHGHARREPAAQRGPSERRARRLRGERGRPEPAHHARLRPGKAARPEHDAKEPSEEPSRSAAHRSMTRSENGERVSPLTLLLLRANRCFSLRTR